MSHQCGLCEGDLPDGYLCPGCTLATAKRLDRMPRLWAALTHFMAPEGQGSGERVSSSRSPRLPVDERVLDLQVVGVVKTLEDWRSFMMQDRGRGEPVLETGLGRRVHVAARALSGSLGWMVDHWPPVGDMAGEVRDLERDVLSIVDPQDTRHLGKRIANCPAVYEDGVICGAVLRHYSGEKSITCRWCNTVYPQVSWADLKAGVWAEGRNEMRDGIRDQKEEPCPSAS
ncbi:hypothetical protein [Streptomyces sp. NPDC008141]|uniref:hypothetical protein n=1 Tax=Streptomyces sp. NPDC008141 TaxID=3364815 RepID=UPI0036E8393B